MSDEFELKFDGRTILIVGTHHVEDPIQFTVALQKACKGPHLRMIAGGLMRTKTPLEFISKTYINTDESIEVITERFKMLLPTKFTVGEVEIEEAKQLWASFEQAQQARRN